ncbi:MAG: hypothetical protein QOI95_1639 [Acidimicrobiaceae bacterium]|jgi:hypothetical protein
MDWRFQSRQLSGLSLRYALIVSLVGVGREVTTRELIAAIEAYGLEIEGRPSKTVSDALRWEVRRGRAVRVGRGRYRAGTVSRQTVWRMRKRLRALHARVVAPTRDTIDLRDDGRPSGYCQN